MVSNGTDPKVLAELERLRKKSLFYQMKALSFLQIAATMALVCFVIYIILFALL